MTEYRDGDPVEILLIEDNPGDVQLTRMAFEDGRVNNDLHVVRDGEQALDFLFERGEYTDASTPDIVLLDLNLPKIDGHEVLKEIRNDDALHHLPVVILTSSEDEEDIVRSYELNSNAVITKPVEASDFLEVVETFEEFWFTVVQLPPKPDNGDVGKSRE